MSHERTLIKDLSVYRPKPLSLAISALIAAPAATAMAQDQSETSDEFMLEEVLVTARKRTENLQMIPQSIQAISAQTIEQAGLRSMDDYVRFIPSLNIVQANPGTAKVIFRGIADAQSTFIAEPSAAVYLDEQSLVVTGQPNPRMVDIERVEALSGPQGTLFGASAQSGVLRIITNKPDPTAFDANIDLGLSSTKSGDMSYDVSGMVNIPLSESWALRLVGFSAKDGGYIDIVEGTTPRFGLVTNDGAAQKNFNDVKTTGGRIAARWFINDDWTMTASIIHQDTKSDGRSEHDPVHAGELNLVRFKPEFEFDDQDWTQYALTFEGDLGFADFVSATSYFTRDWTYTQDTSVGYASYFGTFCYNPYFIAYSRYCFQAQALYDSTYYRGTYYNDGIGYLQNVQQNSKLSQEFRLFHQGETIDWVAGFFYEKSKEAWQFTTFIDDYPESHAWDNFTSGRNIQNGNPIPTRDPEGGWWYSQDDSTFKNWSIFGEATWHISERWDVTAGARWFSRKMDKTYFVELPRYNLTDVGVSHPNTDESDWVPKLSVSFAINDNSLLYALYSEGYRPGGTNRGRGTPFFPVQYDADKLENFELGSKNTFANGRVRLNVTYFNMKWKDYQLEVVDPSWQTCGGDNAPPEPNCGQPWQKVVSNVGNAKSKGLEFQFDWAASEHLSLGANGTWLDAELSDEVDIGILVPAGSRLPLSPEFKGSLYAQYDWDVDWFGANSAWLRLQWSYTGDMLNQVEPLTLDDGPAPQILQPSYNIGDLRFGVDHDKWSLQLYINNLTDERAVLFANPYEFDYFFDRSRVTVNRPRQFGIRWIQRFGE
jgi:outer membrane receptor protein involved in Fe transport